MGRIKTQLVKRLTIQLVRENKDKIKPDFTANKKVVDELMKGGSKKLRNSVAGYVTRLAKKGTE